MGLLDGKVAVVTGAGHGIGRAHALELAKQGAKVVVNDLGGSVRGEAAGTDGAADTTVGLIEKRGGTAVAHHGDVADHELAGDLVRTAIDTFGGLDILVNNAGIVRDAAVWNLSREDFDAVLRVHVAGTWSPCHHAARYWRQRAKTTPGSTGRIVNTTSGAGLGGNFGQTGYASAKAAVVGLTLTLALELHRSGVTVNAVGPSGLTRITATMPGAGEVIEPDDLADDEWHPMDPANSSPLVAWLASDQAQYVTGQVFRSIEDRVIWMQGWRERTAVSAGGRRWEAAELGDRMSIDVFGTRGAGLRFDPA
ncbi:SDR family NAD(P)-dependent oxidoreductase [Actinophytocola sp.]|jgi:NAD(P)-dependent dehydrogenase (short-subunit alcohol dehydrogenase family)|uniref:SDR family NAD(P)-dependent oxidoreductase n=1 Tax=Actinophytocola sp. TaxID=1872138 RepID=UPI002EDA7130